MRLSRAKLNISIRPTSRWANVPRITDAPGASSLTLHEAPGNRERLAPPSTRGGPGAAMAAQHKGHVADSEARSGPRCHVPCLFREAMAQEPQGDQRAPLDEGGGGGVCVTGAHS